MIRRYFPFIVSGVLALFAVVLTRQYLGTNLRKQREALEAERQKIRQQYKAPVDVVVAREDIPKGEVIGIKQLALQPIPENFIQPNATGRPADVIGRVSLAPIFRGEQVLISKVVPPDEVQEEAEALSQVTPKGKRAVTIELDSLSGVGGHIKPGDLVDVLWTTKLPEAVEDEMVTVTLFQAVGVLAVGGMKIGDKKPAADKKSDSFLDSTVTLAMTPQESMLLVYARQQGTIQLSLRAKDDTGQQVAVAPTDVWSMMQTVLGEAAGERPVKTRRKVEIIRGLDRSVVPLGGDAEEEELNSQ